MVEMLLVVPFFRGVFPDPGGCAGSEVGTTDYTTECTMRQNMFRIVECEHH